MKTVTHLNFRGEARAALDFYQSVFGGERRLVSYADAGAAGLALQPDHVLWGQVVSDQGFALMAYDVQADRPWAPGENAFYVSVRGETEAEIQAAWDKLRIGGKVLQALGASAWSPLYGMLRDRFGITWVMDVAPPR